MTNDELMIRDMKRIAIVFAVFVNIWILVTLTIEASVNGLDVHFGSCVSQDDCVK